MTFAAILLQKQDTEKPILGSRKPQTGCSPAHLSKDEGSETSDGSEDGRAGEASGTSLSRGSLSGGRLGDGVVAVRGRSDGRGVDGSSLLRRAGNLNGLGLDGGDGGDVLLGDVSGGVAGALRLLRLLGLLGGLGSLRLLGLLRLAGVLRLLGNGAVSVSRRGRVRVVSRTDGAHGGGDRDGLSHDDGGVSRAVRDLLGAVDDGVDVGGVDGRGGQRDVLNRGTGRAVGDILGAVGDGADASRGDVLGLSRRLGVGHSGGGDDGDSRETHLD
jgi:hypothetical protein